MPGGISIHELESKLALSENRLLEVVVVVVSPSGSYVPFVRASWSPDEFLAIAKYRSGGFRTYADFSGLWAKITGEWRYGGEVRVVPQRHPMVVTLNLLG